MKLPFVSRTEYERVCEENDRLFGLLKLAVSVRKRKKTKEPLKPAVPGVIPEPVIPPGVQWEVERRSGGDPFLRRYLVKYSQEQVALNKSPEEIIDAIRNGDGGDYED